MDGSDEKALIAIRETASMSNAPLPAALFERLVFLDIVSLSLSALIRADELGTELDLRPLLLDVGVLVA